MDFPIETSPEKDAIFVKAYARTKDAVQACAQARIYAHGYDLRDVATVTLERPDIQRLIANAEDHSIPTDITRDSIVSELQEIADRALSAGEFAPAITAKKTQAQLLGFLDQNMTLTVRHDVSTMTDEQLEKLIAAKGHSAKLIEGDFVPSPGGLAALGRA